MVEEPGPPVVSVIVPCYNSERTIRACLTALLSQRTSISFDVIVVDSSTDRTPEIVGQEFPSVRLIHLEERTFAGAARNIGAQSTRAEYCLMIDSDCVAKPDVIERAVSRIRSGVYSVVGGSLRNGTPRSLCGTLGYLIEFKEYIPSAPMRLVQTVPTANALYRRDTLEHHGFFDSDMWLAEDVLFNWRVFSAGEQILFDPSIEVTHLNRTGWKNVMAYQVSLGRLSAMARRRGGMHGDILLRHPGLVLLMPFVRTFNALRWLSTCDKKTLLTFLMLSPLYLAGATFWSFGFFQEAVLDMRR